MFPINVLPSGLIICNQSGKELLWVLLVKSKQLLAILHPSVFCLGVRSLRTHCAQTFFIFKYSWIMHGFLHQKRDVAICSSSLVMHFFCVVVRESHCTAVNIWAVGGQPGLIPSWQFDAHSWNFPPIETLFCNSRQLLHTHRCQPTMDVSSQCTFVCLGICVHTLQRWVSNVYEWPLYIGFHVNDPLCLSDFKAAWIFWTNFWKMLRYQISWKSIQSFVSSVFHIHASPVNCTCYCLLN